MTIGSFVSFTLYLGLLVGPVVQIVSIGSQVTEAFAGLERIRELRDELAEDAGDAEPGAAAAASTGRVEFRDVSFEYEKGVPVLRGDLVRRRARAPSTALVGPSGAGKSTIIGLVAAFYRPTAGHDPRGRPGPLEGAPLRLPRRRSASSSRTTSSSTARVFENIAYARPEAPREARPARGRDRPLRRVRREAARRLRHDRRRARRQALGRPAPARRDRPRDPRRPAHPDPRRGDLLARQRERGAHPGRAWPSS